VDDRVLVDGYAVSKRLPRSPSGDVYSAVELQTRREVVLKLYSSHGLVGQASKSARRERALLRAVKGPGIPEVLDLIESDDKSALVLAPRRGVPLLNWASDALPDLATFIDVAIRTTEILARVHTQQVIHGDLTPSTLWIEASTRTVSLVDFGRARQLGHAESSTTLPVEELRESLLYIAPEQTGRMNRESDLRADLYSLGATLFHVLTGRPAFESDDPLTLVHAHIARIPPSARELRPDVPPAISGILDRLLRKEPGERYSSASALREDLLRCQERLEQEGELDDDLELESTSQVPELKFGERLFGREAELEALHRYAAQAVSGECGLVWIEGESGSGKSALVDTLRQFAMERGGHMARGAFSQDAARTYSAWTQALRSLAQQMLLVSDTRLARYRSSLQDGVGSIAQALIDRVPELAFVLGPVPPVPGLGPRETEARFALAIQRLLAATSRPEEPLVLVLEDLHWADSASLDLLGYLAAREQPDVVSLVLTYDASRLSNEHPMSGLRKRLVDQEVPSQHISLPQLSDDAVRSMIATALGCNAEEAWDLADLVKRKTGNRPLLIHQFMEHVQARGLLRHQASSGWSWDRDAIAHAELPDGALALMASRIALLDPESRELLELSSCAPDGFDLETLESSSELGRVCLARALTLLTEAGFIVSCSTGLRFSHPALREMVADLMEPKERARIHYRMARALLARTSDLARSDEQVFEISRHLKLGAPCLPEEDRFSAIRLHMEASHRALASGAVDTSELYLSTARDTFREEDWQAQHSLGFELFLKSTQLCLLRYRFDGAREHLSVVQGRCSSFEERIDVEVCQLRLLGMTVDPMACTRASLAALRRVGFRFPERPSRLYTAFRIRLLDWKIRLVGERALFRAGSSGHPNRLAALRIIAASAGNLSRVDSYLMAVVSCWIVGENLKHGYLTRAGLSLSVFATWLQVIVGDTRRAQRIGRLAAELGKSDPDPWERLRMELQIHANLNPFWMSRREALGPIAGLVERFREYGDLEYVQFASFMDAFFRALAGDPIAVSRKRFDDLVSEIRRSRRHYPIAEGCQRIFHFLALDEVAPEQLDVVSAEQMAWIDAHPGSARCYVATLWMMVTCILDRPDLAYALSASLGELPHRLVPWVQRVDHVFFRGASAAALAGAAHGSGRGAYRRELRSSHRMLRSFAKHGPDFVHMERLLAAERAQLKGHVSEARRLYLQAFQGARRQGFLHHAAYACERRGRMLVEHCRETEGLQALLEAAELYGKWGFHAKARALSQAGERGFR